MPGSYGRRNTVYQISLVSDPALTTSCDEPAESSAGTTIEEADMTALLHRLLTGHPAARRIQVPPTSRPCPPSAGPSVGLAATAERLATTRELDTLRSLHPRRPSLANSDL